jgi:uncharacterized membrane protein YsdA (DUF1294 family)
MVCEMRQMKALGQLSDMASWALPVAVLAYAIGINLWTAFAFWLDKRRAVAGMWRVPEATLLLLSAAGGWPGAKFAQRRYRHMVQVIALVALAILPMPGSGSFDPIFNLVSAKPERSMPHRFVPGGSGAALRP